MIADSDKSDFKISCRPVSQQEFKAHRMRRDISLSWVLDNMQLSEIVAPQSRLDVNHQSLIVVDD